MALVAEGPEPVVTTDAPLGLVSSSGVTGLVGVVGVVPPVLPVSTLPVITLSIIVSVYVPEAVARFALAPK